MQAIASAVTSDPMQERPTGMAQSDGLVPRVSPLTDGLAGLFEGGDPELVRQLGAEGVRDLRELTDADVLAWSERLGFGYTRILRVVQLARRATAPAAIAEPARASSPRRLRPLRRRGSRRPSARSGPGLRSSSSNGTSSCGPRRRRTAMPPWPNPRSPIRSAKAPADPSPEPRILARPPHDRRRSPPGPGHARRVSSAGRQEPTRNVEWGRAPDGEKGFGPDRSIRDLERLLRSSADEDRGHVAALYRLEQDIRVLLAMASDRYEEMGYFGLLDIAKKEEERETRAGQEWLTPLERLDAAFRERTGRAAVELKQGGAPAELLAKLMVDSRFRTRSLVIEGLEFEMADLRGGMAIFRAHLDGFAALRDPEAGAIATRVDLAASRLRAAKLDLEALREEHNDPSASEAWGKDLEVLLGLVRSNDPERIDRELPAVLERLGQREASMAAALFTTRLDAKLAADIDRRALAISTAADLLSKVAPTSPAPRKATRPTPRSARSRRAGATRTPAPPSSKR
jgi:hypothetical protein